MHQPRALIAVCGQVVKVINKAIEQRSAEKGPQSSKLYGLVFVVSGVFDNYGRDQLKELIDFHGGKVTGSLSSKTDYLLAGANMGPSKKIKADTLGIPIIDESTFTEMINV